MRIVSYAPFERCSCTPAHPVAPRSFTALYLGSLDDMLVAAVQMPRGHRVGLAEVGTFVWKRHASHDSCACSCIICV